MSQRIEQELEMLKNRFPKLERKGNWIRIPDYPLPEGWDRVSTDVAFEIPAQYPGNPPYGIVTPVGLRFNGNQPANYTLSQTEVPFPGDWGRFSWAPKEKWYATDDPKKGSNLVNWAISFAERFREGV